MFVSIIIRLALRWLLWFPFNMDLTFPLTDSTIPYFMQQQKTPFRIDWMDTRFYFYFFFCWIDNDIYVSSAKTKHIVLLQYIAWMYNVCIHTTPYLFHLTFRDIFVILTFQPKAHFTIFIRWNIKNIYRNPMHRQQMTKQKLCFCFCLCFCIFLSHLDNLLTVNIHLLMSVWAVWYSFVWYGSIQLKIYAKKTVRCWKLCSACKSKACPKPGTPYNIKL